MCARTLFYNNVVCIQYSLFVCKLFTTINMNKRINVAAQRHVQAHTIRELRPTSKRPKAKITHTHLKIPPLRVSLASSSHHGKTNAHKRRHATKRALESESKNSQIHKNNSNILQDPAPQFIRPC